jgi:hypothetical protein
MPSLSVERWLALATAGDSRLDFIWVRYSHAVLVCIRIISRLYTGFSLQLSKAMMMPSLVLVGHIIWG